MDQLRGRLTRLRVVLVLALLLLFGVGFGCVLRGGAN